MCLASIATGPSRQLYAERHPKGSSCPIEFLPRSIGNCGLILRREWTLSAHEPMKTSSKSQSHSEDSPGWLRRATDAWSRMDESDRKRSCTSLSVIVPAYNEEYLVETSLARLKVLCESPLLHLIQVIVVDDGSKDGTAEAIARFRNSRNRRLTAISSGGPGSGTRKIRAKALPSAPGYRTSNRTGRHPRCRPRIPSSRPAQNG